VFFSIPSKQQVKNVFDKLLRALYLNVSSFTILLFLLSGTTRQINTYIAELYNIFLLQHMVSF